MPVQTTEHRPEGDHRREDPVRQRATQSQHQEHVLYDRVHYQVQQQLRLHPVIVIYTVNRIYSYEACPLCHELKTSNSKPIFLDNV